MNTTSIIADIKRIITICNKSNDIKELIDSSGRLSGYLIYLFEEESQAHKQYLMAYHERKYKEADELLKADGSVKARECIAIFKCVEYRKTEAEWETLWNQLKGYRTQVNQVIDVLTQKIAQLRKEWEMNKFNS